MNMRRALSEFREGFAVGFLGSSCLILFTIVCIPFILDMIRFYGGL